MKNRVCYSCGNTKTCMNGNGSPSWFLNRDTEFVLCAYCYKILIWAPNNTERIRNTSRKDTKKWRNNNPERVKEINSRQFRFKDKRIYDDREPRTGVCNLCRAVRGIDCKTTALHHEKYDPNNPKAHTIELCPSCHITFHWNNK